MVWINIEDGAPPQNTVVCICFKNKKDNYWMSNTLHEKCLINFVEEGIDLFWTYLPESLCPISQNTTEYEKP